MANVAESLLVSGRTSHNVAQFGFADSVPISVFQQLGQKLKTVGIEPGQPSNSREPDYISSETDSSNPTIEPIAVVGMACRAPGAEDVQQLWEVIHSGKCMVTEVPKTRIDVQDTFRAKQDEKWISGRKFFGNFISDADAFDNGFFSISAREASAMEPQQRLLLETTFQAVESSGYLHTHESQQGDPVGVFIGASFVDYEEQLSCYPPSAYTSTGTIRAFLCGRISHFFGWSGPAEVIDTACSSSLVAVNRACKALQAKECSMAVAGGVNLMTTATEFLNLAKAGF